MKVDYKPTVEDAAMGLDESVADPFAVDLFSERGAGIATATATATDASAVGADETSWGSHLPRVTEAEFQASATMASLPTWFYATLETAFTSVLSRFTNTPPDQVHFHLADLRETNFPS